MFFGVGALYAQEHPFDTTLVEHNHTFFIRTRNVDSSEVILSIKCDFKPMVSDTLWDLWEIQITDFNKDGYKDILLSYPANGAANFTYDLYLFDTAINSFKSIAGFEDYPEALSLTVDHRYYYSYERAGCADMNWVSDLFTIQNFKIIHLGHIDGKGCDDADKSNEVIKAYKSINYNNDKETLIEQLPYNSNIPDNTSKWDFLKKYWNTNYKKFL